MLKIPACICFFMGCLGFGYFKVMEYKRRYEELIYIRYILNMLLLETEHKRGTLGESCLFLASKVKEPYKVIFAGLYDLLEKERKQMPQRYWEEKMQELAPEISLRKDEADILKGVIRCADGTTMEMPVEVLKESITEWEKIIAAEEKTRKEKSRVTICLSLTTGLLLCILVI